jgi:hypothetical protein
MPDYTIHTLDLLFLGQPHSTAFLVIGLAAGAGRNRAGPTVPALTRARWRHTACSRPACATCSSRTSTSTTPARRLAGAAGRARASHLTSARRT